MRAFRPVHPLFLPLTGIARGGTLEAATDKLLVDDAYTAMFDDGAQFGTQGADDALLQLVYGEPDLTRQIDYVSTVEAVCANGSVTRGIELSVEIAQRSEKASGLLVPPRPQPYGIYETRRSVVSRRM
jgi:hypothetical protein